MESLFSLLRKNVFDWKRRESRQELRLATVTWIERTYHRRRRQLVLGKLTPIEYETINSMTRPAYVVKKPESSNSGHTRGPLNR